MNNKYRLNIDGKEVTGFPGQTILQVARDNDIFIPTLCYDERTEIYGSCGLCVVELEGNPKLCKACATEIADRMVIMTGTERVIQSRKTNLELLLSNHTGDCRPPCSLKCPANTDCQGYVGLIANKEYKKAIELIKEKIPLPASIGRVCPHPCEKDCRRGLEDEPISILNLKRFVADMDLKSENPYIPPVGKATGKKVAIIGSGPMGISAAAFLRQMGHRVTVYEAMPKAGGMLRYGIPEYRLPKKVLDIEIKQIEKMGVKLLTNTRVGTDISFNKIRNDFDAVLMGIGAWVSTGTGCPGEDSEGVIGGIDFLRKIVRNEPIPLGERVAIIGGGNTAMDACRSAVRFGAKEVYNVYRRTKDQMPADKMEIDEAEEEGVIFKTLTTPIEIKADENGKVKQVVLQVMGLGEADESGRRKPIPIEGKTETLDVDTVILAIGQAVDSKLFDGLDTTRKKGIAYDEDTFMTSIPGVFAGGDCGNDKISIAIEAIADARKASYVIDAYLHGTHIKYENPFVVKRHDITEETFEDREKKFRTHLDILDAEERKGNFEEVAPALTVEQAVTEANRCLECGCHDYYECKLINYANQYDVKPERFKGEVKKLEDFQDEHPFILRDPNKCILCGLCVRVCDQVMGIGALGLVHRGFDTLVMPALENSLEKSGCICCGQCVSVCPTGALKGKKFVDKEVPLKADRIKTTCSYCAVGCGLKIEYSGNMLIKAVADKHAPVSKGLLCGKGKFGFDCSLLEGKITTPMVKTDSGFEAATYDEAFILIAKKLQAIATKYGPHAIGVAISDRFTNEEAYVMQKLAKVFGAKALCFDNRQSGIKEVLGHDASPNTINELLSTDVILIAGYNIINNTVMNIKLKQASDLGSKVILIDPIGYEQPMSFAQTVYTDNTLTALKQIAKYIVESGCGKAFENYQEFAASLEGVEVSDEMADIAKTYLEAKKSMIVFSQNFVTVDTARLIGDIALASGHIGKPRDGILQLKPKNNSQGIIDLGITDGIESMEGLKALVVCGEDPAASFTGKQGTPIFDTKDIQFMAVLDTHVTKTGEMADVVLPSTGFACTNGTYTNTERRRQCVRAAIDEGVQYNNWQVASAIADILEVDFGFTNEDDIASEMKDKVCAYKNSTLGEVYGGVLIPKNPKLVPIKGDLFAQPLKCTDNLMNTIADRIPKRAHN